MGADLWAFDKQIDMLAWSDPIRQITASLSRTVEQRTGYSKEKLNLVETKEPKSFPLTYIESSCLDQSAIVAL